MCDVWCDLLNVSLHVLYILNLYLVTYWRARPLYQCPGDGPLTEEKSVLSNFGSVAWG